jgi:hypothetical protein
MEQTKLTVRVPRRVLDDAKRYAAERQTTLTRLITEYLRAMAQPEDALSSAPVVRRLSGALSTAIGEEDYRRYLDEKYGADDDRPL